MIIQLNVMTLNMRHGRGLDGKVNLQRVAHLIEQVNADIIGLNEVDKFFSRRSNFIDQGKWLANELNMYYIFGPAISFRWKHQREYGNAILSRYPIVEHRNHIFRLKAPIAEPRSILETVVDVGKFKLQVIISHFSIHPILQRKQLLYCLEVNDTSPIIIMGDFNRTPRSSSYERMVQNYQDCIAAKTTYTFPSKKPRSRLDYIFVSEHIKVQNANIVQSDVSDHLPVVAQVEF